MKKAIGIVVSILVVTCVAAMILYYIRASKAEQQYVHRNSAGILSLAVDDLLIDNLGSLMSARSKQGSSNDSLTKTLLQDIWNAGIDIPARIYLYSLPEDSHSYYSVQKINDQAQWDTFLQKYKLETETSADGTAIHLSKNIALLQSGDKILFRLALRDSSSPSFTAEVLQQEDNWLQIRQLNAVKKLPKQDHLSYWTLDSELSIQAHIHNDKTEIQGSWQLDRALPKGQYEARAFNANDIALLFWSQLPISSIPLLTEALSHFSNTVAGDKASSQPRYMDLLVRQQTVSQQDTIITYDYDEDFNSVETSAIQEIQVPMIESVWQGDSTFAQQLPDKMFYKFNKEVNGQHIFLSTDANPHKDIKFAKKDALLALVMDFNYWPSTWLIQPFKSLQQQALQANIKITAKDEKLMEIKGELRYKPILH